MSSGIAASVVASKIPRLSRTAWARTANRLSTRPPWRSHIHDGPGFSHFTTRATPHEHIPSSVPPTPRSGRLARTSRGLVYFGLGVGVAWYLDREFYASAVSRNARTLWTVRVLRFSPWLSAHACLHVVCEDSPRLQAQFQCEKQ